MNNPFVITIGADSVRMCVGSARAMSEPQFVFSSRRDADLAAAVYESKNPKQAGRLTVLPASGHSPDLACPYVRVRDGAIVDF